MHNRPLGIEIGPKSEECIYRHESSHAYLCR
jgi:hypothetical protein